MKFKKGIILAAGKGTRLAPATKVTVKPLLPLYDKPLLYYALSNLINAGVREVLFISQKQDIPQFKKLFGTGKQLGMKFSYTYQKKQIGIPDAINIAEKFIAKKPFILALADNLFIGKSFKSVLRQVQLTKSEAAVLAVKTKYPSKSAVIEFDKKKNIQSIIEKPKNPKSNLTIPGLYFYDHQSIPVIKKLKPSKRGELEIVDIHLFYLQRENLNVFPLNKDVKWFDTGDAEEMLEASNYVHKYQKKNKTLVGSIELESYKNGWISKKQLKMLINQLPGSNYKLSLEHFYK
jgi:glucose-1-phosphate thymidylyltransferase